MIAENTKLHSEPLANDSEVSKSGKPGRHVAGVTDFAARRSGIGITVV